MASALVETYAEREGKTAADLLSDEGLLEQFLNADELTSQEAFKALVERHGPMVLGICRHVLSQHHDAEDAFQATFLVLAKKGATIRNRRVLAGWLHEVAHRIAIKARASAVRRRTIERQGVAMSPPKIEPDNQDEAAAWSELRPVLHAEVERLPERYRIPVILSYLEGKTNEEVAALLQWPVGTVKGRLSRARDMLRSRLTRRGLTLAAAFLMTALSRGTVFAEVVPADLVRRTVRLAGKFGSRSVPPDPQGPRSGTLAERVRAISYQSLMNGVSLRFSPRDIRMLVLAVLSFSIATGIWVAMLSARGVSPVPGSVSPPGSVKVRAADATCH
jgi:RNA polymerase sigma factor (sigma-70 family)